MNRKKGELINKGKTKKIFAVEGYYDLVWVENLNEITANDDPAFTNRFGTKAVCATTTTVKVFELLNACGIPTAFVERISDTEFIAKNCEMIQLEVITRRLAVGSYTQRRPDLKASEGQKPHRFHRLVTEFFLKTTKGKFNGNDIGLPDIPAKGGGTKPLDDPLIKNAWDEDNEDTWQLFMPKQPEWEDGADLNITVRPQDVLIPKTVEPKERMSNDLRIRELDTFNRKAFLLVERAWAILGFTLVDWKIEFGWTTDGQLVISDVIDNDSWRLKGPDFEELSKQLHRDGQPMDKIAAKYGYVSQMVKQFRLPKQVLVEWKGSPDDKFPVPIFIRSIDKKEVILSGHKKTNACLVELEKLQRDYSEGGVILAVVGMSNGLGPVLSSHTIWPVIGVPATANEHPEDVWSSLRLPSQNPMATILSPKNAVLFALNILAQKNPAAYMERQFAIEELDTGY